MCSQKADEETEKESKEHYYPVFPHLTPLFFLSKPMSPPKPPLILSHRPCRTSASSFPLFHGSLNETQVPIPSLLNLFSSLSASISQYLHALRSRMRSGRICVESVEAGSGLMEKLVEMRGMGGEMSSVVCKPALFPSLDSLRGQL